MLITRAMRLYIGDSGDIVIPGAVNGLSVTRIGERTFAAKALESVVIPEGVVEIGDYAFNGNKGNPQDLTIKGYAGSTAQACTTANGHTFTELICRY